jgi:hypothetical protein
LPFRRRHRIRTPQRPGQQSETPQPNREDCPQLPPVSVFADRKTFGSKAGFSCDGTLQGLISLDIGLTNKLPKPLRSFDALCRMQKLQKQPTHSARSDEKLNAHFRGNS